MESHDNDPSAGERRRHLHLRVIYAEASDHIDCLFHHHHDWAGSSADFLAFRLIHETYPHLHGDDVRTLVQAIERAHQADWESHPSR